jgi:isopentenyl-diphosphate delta-isomerase
VLVTRRAVTKRTFPGVWSNAFCGHPSPGEDPADAVQRRAGRELGLTLRDVELVLPSFRYRAADAAGVVENEICPVFRAVTDADPTPAADEVDAWAWVEPAQLNAAVALTPFAWSPWLVLQLREWDEYGA